MSSQFYLLPQEEIFDLTTQQLEEQLTLINRYLDANPSPEVKSKAKETRDMISQQIDERTLIQQFEALCNKDTVHNKEQPVNYSEQVFKKKLDDFNAQFQILVEQVTKAEDPYKLSMPSETQQIERIQDIRNDTKSVMRTSKIKKLGIENQKADFKKQEPKIATKPKLIQKSTKKASKTVTTIPQSKITKREQHQMPIKSSSKIQEKPLITQTKTIKSGVVQQKKGSKKMSKKDANDWLVQMVREEEERKLRQLNNPRSSIMIPNDGSVPIGKECVDVDTTLKMQQSTIIAMNQKKVQSNQYHSDQKEDKPLITVKNTLKTQQQESHEAQSQRETKVKSEQQKQKHNFSQDNLSTKAQEKYALGDQRKNVMIQIKQQTVSFENILKSEPPSQAIISSSTKKTEDSMDSIVAPINSSFKVGAISNRQQSSANTNTVKVSDYQNIYSEVKEHNASSIQTISTKNDTFETKVKETIQITQTQEQDSNEEQQHKVDTQKNEKKHKVSINKACYSQQYWERVRKQALTNLERVKLMKELRQSEKQHILSEIKLVQHQQIPQQKQITSQQKQDSTNEQSKLQQDIHNQKTETKKEVSQKISLPKKFGQKRKPTVAKKNQPLLIKLPEVVPNYLDRYPTFNHIFSVMYYKPQAEALLDIQTLMKQMVAINSHHINSLTTSSSYKKPMFRAFDNTCMYVNDARQLLLHAQTTNIDLKTLLNRLNIFNENLHGRFETKPQDILYYRVVKSREQVYDIITTAFLRTTHWQQLPHGMNLKTSWNILWSWAKPEVDFNKLLVFQKVNHFPFNKNMSRKDLLYKNLQNFRKVCKTSIGFVPLTFNLPKQYSAFSAKFHEQQSLQGAMNIWIMKPIGKSRGRGIKLINNLTDLNYLDSIVVQKYLKNPLLLDGYKFDLRVYVLVTSIHPLQVFIYKQGFARLSTEKYSLDLYSLKNTFVHLTNFSIQKNNKDAQNSTEDGGSKITFKLLQYKLEQLGINWSTIWYKIHDIIIKSLLGCSLVMPPSPSAFELFGYDVIIDTNSDVHLIQINASPSLERTFLIDQIVKQSLIDDIIELMEFPIIDRLQCVNVMTQRLQRKTPSNSLEDNIDIGRILRFKPLRNIGELPSKMGLFERVAPSQRSEPLQRLINSKYNPNIKYADVWN